MASYYKEGNKLAFAGYTGTIVQITETYRKNVIVLKVSNQAQYVKRKADTIGIFEYPCGRLEFMSVIST